MYHHLVIKGLLTMNIYYILNSALRGSTVFEAEKKVLERLKLEREISNVKLFEIISRNISPNKGLMDYM